jgi:hypothetical protein
MFRAPMHQNVHRCAITLPTGNSRVPPLSPAPASARLATASWAGSSKARRRLAIASKSPAATGRTQNSPEKCVRPLSHPAESAASLTSQPPVKESPDKRHVQAPPPLSASLLSPAGGPAVAPSPGGGAIRSAVRGDGGSGLSGCRAKRVVCTLCAVSAELHQSQRSSASYRLNGNLLS